MGALVAAGLLAAGLAAAPAAPADGIGIQFFNAKAHGPTSSIQPAPASVVTGPVGEPALRIVSAKRLQWRERILTAVPRAEAGAHVDGSALVQVTGINDQPDGLELSNPVEATRDVIVETPPGFAGNPQAVPQCKMTDFYAIDEENKPTPIGKSDVAGRCTPASQIGVAGVYAGLGLGQFLVPVYNLKPPADKPAAFGFWTPWSQVANIIYADVNPANGYRVEAGAKAIPTYSLFRMAFVSLWGVPHAAANAPWRWDPTARSWGYQVVGSVIRPFLSNPTDCDSGELTTDLHVRSWNQPTRWVDGFDVAPQSTGCDQVDFSASMKAQPSQQQAGEPSGAEVKMNLGYSENPNGVANSPLRDAMVVFPPGVTVSPSAANGLKACTLAEIGLKERGAPRCPDASKIASIRVRTPLLADPLVGSLYIAEQGAGNPFGSLMAVYLHVYGSGVHVKLPGRVDLDPVTGQITSTFKDNPQLPFTELELRLKSGNRAPLVLPSTCGTFTTETTLTPWSYPQSGSVAETPTRFELKPSDGCVSSLADRGFVPTMDAGSADPIGGAHSEFVARFQRGDMEQEFDRIQVKTPEGLAATLRGVSSCPEAGIAQAFSRDKLGDGATEIADPSCADSARVGKVLVGAGPGASPFYATGKVYLAGPYDGDPLSLVFVVPAVAGPFDLGVQAVRAGISVNPLTAQITTSSSEIPKILQGVPLKVKDIRVIMDREGFTVNPTSCAVKEVAGAVHGTSSKVASVSSRFQVADCAALAFNPKLSLKLKGATKRGGYPALESVVTAKPGQANIGRVSVALPRSAFLAQEHIRTVCTRVQFAAGKGNGAECPKGSIYGYAEAITPLLDKPLQGNAYLRSSSNPLPDLVLALNGPPEQPIQIELVGRIDSKNEGIRTTFDVVPDAPVTKFTLRMGGGQKSLITNSRDLCKTTNKATVKMNGQNGRRLSIRPVVKPQGCKKAARKAKKSKR